ncbi:MAG TPA: methyltransferase domain-containing protein [Candidatus Paceibacterota bacterium]|nr:methyltransferase domain-containing protein [Candidatus Paceibacterota bacterium]
MKDTDYYNQESVNYSRKRYPERETDYVQYFFKRRLKLVLGMLGRFLKNRPAPAALLEVGIADGVVLRAAYDAFSAKLGRVEGNDIAPDMVAAAKAANGARPIAYFVREGALLHGGFDVVLEVGVLNYAPWQEDLKAAHGALRPGGVYICSIAGQGSLHARMRGGEEGFENMLSYREYEEYMRSLFTIVQTVPCGFFVPFIWRFPALARVLQRLAEACMLPVAPGLAHEKVYVLQK